MTFAAILLIAIGLAMDCFAVSIGVGCSICHSKNLVMRMSFHFGLFQVGMTLLGWFAGKTITTYVSSFDHWIALVLLVFIGVRMILAGLSNDDGVNRDIDASRGATLIMLSLATSMDALAVGLSLAFLHGDITSASIVIGLVSLVMTIIGLTIGRRLGIQFGRRMGILGGVILIGIGLNILYTHLAGG